MNKSDEQYRTFWLSHFGCEVSVAVYANNDSTRCSNRNEGDVVVYTSIGPTTCGLHMSPDEARNMARMLLLAADEAFPLPLTVSETA